jgi:hypothetical protein
VFFRNVDILKMEAVCFFEMMVSYRWRQYVLPKRQYPEDGGTIFLRNDGILQMERVRTSETLVL